MKSSPFKLNRRAVSAEDHISRLLLITLITTAIATLLALAGCGNDDDKQASDSVRKVLTANEWKIQSVSIDGTDGTSLFTGLTVQFTNTGYTATQGGIVWPASGTWAFADDSGKTIIRDDGTLVTIREIKGGKLVVNLMWLTTTLGPGRVSATSGEHTFTFVNQ